jgi:hypothetical protein
MRRGFALLITLAVLAVLIAISAMTIAMLSDAERRSIGVRALIEADLVYEDAAKVLQREAGDESLRGMLLAAPVGITGKRSDFSAIMQCRASRHTVNINWLKSGKTDRERFLSEAAERMLDETALRYELDDAERLKSLLRDYFDDPLNGDMHFAAFYDIVMRYLLETGDTNIRRVPWRNLFVFEPIDNVEDEKIAGDYMDAEAISLFFGADMQYVREERPVPGGPLKDLLLSSGYWDENFASLFYEGAAKSMLCEVDFSYRKRNYAFRFYEREGKVGRFVFLGEKR